MKCLYVEDSTFFEPILNIPMQMKNATEKWIESKVHDDDCAAVQAYFDRYCRHMTDPDKTYTPEIKFRAASSQGIIRNYEGIFLSVGDGISLFCCKNISDAESVDSLMNENVFLRSINQNMKDLVMHFTDGIAAFEITGDHVIPLYASRQRM